MKLGIFAAASAAFVIAASPAAADVLTLKTYGEVNRGYDAFGIFGTVGDLAGKNYVLTTVWDMAKPSFHNPGVSYAVQGMGANSPLISAELQIVGGGSYVFHTPEFSSISVDTGLLSTNFYVGTPALTENLDFRHLSGDYPLMLDTDFETTTGANPFPLSTFNIVHRDPVTNAVLSGFSGEVYVDKNVGQVTATGAIPEPATWALMIGGFGMAGAMLRRRRLALA